MRKRYQNPDNIESTKSFKDIVRWMKERRSKKIDLSKKISQSTNKEIERIKENKSDFSITWIGHATFLIQMKGLNILTDPVWPNLTGIPKRLTEPGILIKELPAIDLVFISHSHYDHLDFSSIKKLSGSPAYYVPIGLKPAFLKRGFHKVVEANWWDSFFYKGLEITFVPAQHWAKRALFDTNTSHWGGWIIEDKQKNRSVYFVGDTRYFNGFREIGAKFAIDIVLMPIGAYEPEWFMKSSHINPEDAVKAFIELKGKIFIPMHYGTYHLADDTGPEALIRLNKGWDRFGLEDTMLKVLKIGESAWMD